jgi:zinc protease
MEEANQNGLAHFIEHMAFNGTNKIPEGEYVRILERQGLAFGRDTNAFTAPDQTVYELNIPGSNDGKVDTALFIMREVASEIQFGAEAIERERGIIQSEDRSMYPPLRRASVERDRFC